MPQPFTRVALPSCIGAPLLVGGKGERTAWSLEGLAINLNELEIT